MSTDDKHDAMSDAETKALAASVAAKLDDSVPADIAARLRAARQEAVFVAERKTRKRGWGVSLAPIGATAAACAVLVVALNRAPENTLPLLDDAEMAAAAELELLEELEMLAWLDEAILDAG